VFCDISLSMKKISRSVQQTHKIAKEVLDKVLPFSFISGKAVVVALEGDLGSGKTHFVQGFAEHLGIKEKITSPTFVILKKFKIPRQGGTGIKNLIHIDAYRIEKPEEILELRWDEFINDPDNIILVEWADKIRNILPKKYFLVKLKFISEKERSLDIILVS
ncbi:MAG: tRNA (adenosine(37)-N6)-threonylcarbamoyltransferase complex ATPase subunit type 1 TsaE, partial [bacterium]|nr:tRNA (adenosine(37)-N6)-threonylcarbamoyltransferase complex ATPase subunit type 1 TsaE [bacterium]